MKLLFQHFHKEVIQIEKIKILIVDDSRFIRNMLTEELNKIPDFMVIDDAPNPYIAREKIIKNKPDILLLDIHMPRMDGLSFLKKLMLSFPLKVIIISSLAQKGGTVSLQAIEAGALEVISKPSESYTLDEMLEELIEKIYAVHSIREERLKNIQDLYIKRANPGKIKSVKHTKKGLIIIGASTGGTEAIESILSQMPKDCPPILVVQHMPENYTKSFAERLNRSCTVRVKEAKHLEILEDGLALIAPGNSHMLVKKQGGAYYVRLDNEGLVNHHRPSVDVLLESAAQLDCTQMVAIILTGMGKDGAKAINDIHKKGAYTIAQNEETCIVFGMPKAAIASGGIDKILAINKIAQHVVDVFSKREGS